MDVISKYPELVLPILRALAASPDIEVHVLTDMDLVTAVDMLARNRFVIPLARVHACDYTAHGDACKAVKARELGLDVLVDDHLGYVSVPGAPPLRLLVMPDASRDYYAPDWKTDGSEGAFGRRLQKHTAET